MIQGDSDLEGITVRDAYSGITLLSGDVATIDNCRLEENMIGIHLYGRSPLIRNCHFLRNESYGLKEDALAAPVMVDNRFIANGYAYYDLLETVIGAEELNRMDGNSGNTEE